MTMLWHDNSDSWRNEGVDACTAVLVRVQADLLTTEETAEREALYRAQGSCVHRFVARAAGGGAGVFPVWSIGSLEQY